MHTRLKVSVARKNAYAKEIFRFHSAGNFGVNGPRISYASCAAVAGQIKAHLVESILKARLL